MGTLEDGKWARRGFPVDEAGRFQRGTTAFRGFVEPGSAVAGRYRLYVSYACPWAHRCLVTRALRGLEDVIEVSVVHWLMGPDGWTFEPGDGVVADPDGAKLLSDVYLRADSRFSGRVTVPVLWDKQERTIVNNESREIVRMLDDSFRHLGRADVHFHPADLHDEVERVIDAIYEPINNGVYKCGFARSQAAYDEAVQELFDALDHWESVLARQRYLCGSRLTEADIFLFTTLVRFEHVYHYHFKCNVRRLRDYPNLWGFTKELYQLPGVAATTRFDHIKQHYYGSHESLNPSRVVPAGPVVDLTTTHGRA